MGTQTRRSGWSFCDDGVLLGEGPSCHRRCHALALGHLRVRAPIGERLQGVAGEVRLIHDDVRGREGAGDPSQQFGDRRRISLLGSSQHRTQLGVGQHLLRAISRRGPSVPTAADGDRRGVSSCRANATTIRSPSSGSLIMPGALPPIPFPKQWVTQMVPPDRAKAMLVCRSTGGAAATRAAADPGRGADQPRSRTRPGRRYGARRAPWCGSSSQRRRRRHQLCASQRS